MTTSHIFFAPYRSGLATLSLGALALALIGCGKTGPGAGTPTTCRSQESAVIDDGEDNNNQTLVIDDRGGYWYTFVDDAGSTVAPTAGAQGGTFQMSEGGARGGSYAARFQGQIAATGTLFSGMGMNFIDPKGTYDAASYDGISFYAKRGPDSTGNVRLKIPDSYTDPDGGHCSECYNDLGYDLRLTEDWELYEIPFSKLRQMPGWGRPHRAKLERTSVYGIQFQVNQPGAKYDIWVDDLQFIGGCAR